MNEPNPKARFYQKNHAIPKLQLIEIFPLTPFLDNHEKIVSIEVGANIGLWSEAFLTTFGARIDRHVMIEPMPVNVEHLRRRWDMYMTNLADGQIRLVESAAGDVAGKATIHYDREVTSLASISNDRSEFGDRSVALSKSLEVPVRTVADVMEEHGLGTVHIVKIDVEGYERQVMTGMEDLMQAGRIRTILFEFGSHQTRNGETFGDFHAYLTNLGYDVYKPLRGVNFFGFAPVPKYHPRLEPEPRSVEMILATLDKPSEEYIGPRVIGRPYGAQPSKPRRALFRMFKGRS